MYSCACIGGAYLLSSVVWSCDAYNIIYCHKVWYNVRKKALSISLDLLHYFVFFLFKISIAFIRSHPCPTLRPIFAFRLFARDEMRVPPLQREDSHFFHKISSYTQYGNNPMSYVNSSICLFVLSLHKLAMYFVARSQTYSYILIMHYTFDYMLAAPHRCHDLTEPWINFFHMIIIIMEMIHSRVQLRRK